MHKLLNALEDMGIAYQEDTASQFQRYMDLILEWNEKVNLTTITDKDEFIMKHYIDSIAICRFPQLKNADSILDVGTGAGFPGIPLAILNPDKEFVLLDSLNKRIKIISDAAREVGLENVRFLHGRAEEFAHKKEYRECFDLCVSRAVANLAVLSEYCLPFVRVGGWFAAYKSAAAEEEITEGGKAVKLLGGELKENCKLDIMDFELDHRILMIKKIRNTISKYPRKAGTPAKEPLK